jgi:hypothetical protein
MNEQIIAWAREAGINNSRNGVFFQCNLNDLERFAALVAEAAALKEREACAKVCETYDGSWYAYRKGAQECAAAIRNRGTA